MRGPIKLRSGLVWLTIAAVTPIVVFAVYMVTIVAKEQRSRLERGAFETARALMTAVDSEIVGTITAATALSASNALAADRLSDFYGEALPAFSRQAHWAGCALLDPTGVQLLDLAVPLHTDLGEFGASTLVSEVLATKQPVTSDLFWNEVLNTYVIAVGVPVFKGDRVRYVLAVSMWPHTVNEILDRQRLTPTWTAWVLDRQQVSIGRVPPPTTPASFAETGQQLPELRTVMASLSNEGWSRFMNLAGQTIDAIQIRAPVSGWSLVMEIPPGALEEPVRGTLGILLFGCLGLTLVGIAMAAVVARHISRPIGRLADAAHHLGSEKDLPLPAFNTLAEVGELEGSLRRAHELLRQRGQERTAFEDVLRQRAKELEAANRAKDEFLATVSHELRAPLNAIHGWVQVLRHGELDKATFDRAIETLERNVHLQEQLIADLLDVSRIVLGKFNLNPRPVDLVAIVSAVVDIIRPTAHAKSITIHTSIAVRKALVMGEPERLHQVVWNLLSNAVKFTPRQGQIWLSLTQREDEVSLRVEDSGQGIPPDFLPHIFERFTQADVGSRRAHRGLGLGLAIVRHITEAHGGTVTAESAGEGGGAIFSVSIPLSTAEGHPGNVSTTLRPVTTVKGSSALGLQGCSILVVDDEPDARDVLSLILERNGARVAVAGSVSEALRSLNGGSVDAIVSDIAMPEADGYALAQQIRQRRDQAGIVCIALTAHGRVEDRERALHAGFDAHLVKPASPFVLIQTIQRLIGEKRIRQTFNVRRR